MTRSLLRHRNVEAFTPLDGGIEASPPGGRGWGWVRPILQHLNVGLISPLKRAQRGQSTVEYALICAFILIVITATMLRFTDIPAKLGQQLADQLVFELGRHWRGVLTFF